MKEIKILHVTTHNEDCGIARYQEQYLSYMSKSKKVKNTIFKYSPNVIKVKSQKEINDVLEKLKTELYSHNILHIQHELSFFKKQELRQMIKLCNKMKRRVVVTIHTSPEAGVPHPGLPGLGIRSTLNLVKQIISKQKFLRRYYYPLKKADLVLVHNKVTRDDLVQYGIHKKKIQILTHPVPLPDLSKTSTLIKKKLHKKKFDIVYCTVGFLSESKGIKHALMALTMLPANYKLAIIGGMHPASESSLFFDELQEIIHKYKLDDRVYITGFIEDPEMLNALVRETDICVYPYDARYYSYVSSGSLNTAIANYKPVVAYRTKTFEEVKTDGATPVTFCKEPDYKSLAKTLNKLDINAGIKESMKYANELSWDKQAKALEDIYLSNI